MANPNIQAGVNQLQIDDIQILNSNDDFNLIAKRDINYLAPILQDVGIDSKYYDINDLIQTHTIDNTDKLLILSLNIQAIRSKFMSLSIFLNTILEREIKIDIICLQETNFFYQELYQLPGYKLYHALLFSFKFM